MTEELEFVNRLVGCLCNVQLRMVEGSSEAVDAFVRELTLGALAQSNSRSFRKRLLSLKPGCVYEVRSLFEIRFAVMRDKERLLVVGPCRTDSYSQKQIESLARRYKLDRKTASEICRYCAQLPEISYEGFRGLSSLVAERYMGIAEPVPFEHIEQKDELNLKRELMTESYEEVSRMRLIERRYEYSAAMTEAVKQGNLTLAMSFLRQMRPATNEIVRNPNPLRNSQNLCIIANTQLRHAMEESGIHPYVLDKVSNEIAVRIEKLRSQKEATAFSMEIIRRYCELAGAPKVSRLRPFSRLAVTYIKEHLTDNLTVKSTAEALVVNPNYLSSQFHKEVGCTFTDYVNSERAEQAAALLLHTNLPVQHIASSVGYNNTSYFAKQFARRFGMSPSAYRGQRESNTLQD